MEHPGKTGGWELSAHSQNPWCTQLCADDGAKAFPSALWIRTLVHDFYKIDLTWKGTLA